MASLEETIVHGESEAIEEHIFDIVGFAFLGVENSIVSNGKKSTLPASDARNNTVITRFHARGFVVPSS